ncbi:hypothetical protein [Neolewinella maritima]|uniref:hypothetical protein n=1 Tax=Neolewinella maritima TaxID=1383882 RepID=UPI001EE88D54|nr:hypothetical protein [Neolewinella maritima]
MTTKTDVGEFRSTQSDVYTYAKGKQVYAFWGLIPLTRTKVNTPSHGSCQVVTRSNFGDFLITGLTGGLISTHTIKIKANRNQQLAPSPGAPEPVISASGN